MRKSDGSIQLLPPPSLLVRWFLIGLAIGLLVMTIINVLK